MAGAGPEAGRAKGLLATAGCELSDTYAAPQEKPSDGDGDTWT
jgi:hypothetical protein